MNRRFRWIRSCHTVGQRKANGFRYSRSEIKRWIYSVCFALTISVSLTKATATSTLIFWFGQSMIAASMWRNRPCLCWTMRRPIGHTNSSRRWSNGGNRIYIFSFCRSIRRTWTLRKPFGGKPNTNGSDRVITAHSPNTKKRSKPFSTASEQNTKSLSAKWRSKVILLGCLSSRAEIDYTILHDG